MIIQSFIFVIFLLMVIPAAFAENTLENTNLLAESATISLDIEFGEDTIKQGLARDWITNHLDAVTLTFYGDEIPLTEPELKITSTGNNFRISSIPEGILIYGHKNLDLENYKINIYLATDKGLNKFSVTSAAQLPDDKVVETEPKEEKAAYVPDLCMTSSHDFKTYWKQYFNVDIQSFDCNINSDPKSANDFEGRIDGVDVKVLITLEDEQVATLSGVTANNGHWDGAYYFVENISAPGEYGIDIILSYLGQTITKTTSMFIIGVAAGTGGQNSSPITNAGIDQTVDEHDDVIPTFTEVTLDGTASSDPDRDVLTYFWTQTSGTSVTLSDRTAPQPTFTAPDIAATENLIFELLVTDSAGAQSNAADSVTITITFVD